MSTQGAGRRPPRTIDEPVTLTRVYTRHGDGGETRLGDGTRASKSDVRVEAYGTVDELNATLGLVLADHALPDSLRALLTRVQNELFDLGADLSVPAGEGTGRRLRIEPGQVEWLERRCDALNADLPALRSFVLPGGSDASARLHLARTVCRRAERRVVALVNHATVNPCAVAYLNRLGDLLFIVTRHVNAAQGVTEPLWRPGASTTARAAEALFSE